MEHRPATANKQPKDNFRRNRFILGGIAASLVVGLSIYAANDRPLWSTPNLASIFTTDS